MAGEKGLELFDLAVIQKIKKAYPNSVMSPPESVFKNLAKEMQVTKISFPVLGVWRLPDFSLNATTAHFHNGFADRPGLRSTISNTSVDNISVSLKYQFDVWALDRSSADLLVCEIIKLLIKKPIVAVPIEQEGISLECNLSIDPDVVGDFSPSEFDDTGTLYRMTITGTMENAQILQYSNVDIALSVPISIMESGGE